MMGAIISATVLLPVLLGVVTVEGGARCPSPELVEQRLSQLLGRDSPDHVASVEISGSWLRLALRTAEGRLLAHKSLPKEGSCEGLGDVAAVVIAAWEMQLREGTLTLPEDAGSAVPPQPDASAPPALVVPDAPIAEVPLQPAALPSEPVPAPVSRPPIEPRVDLAGSFGYSDARASGVLLRGVLGRSRLGAVALLQLEQAREAPLGAGRIRWNRPLLGAGGRYVALSGSPRVELDAGVAAAWLLLRGTGFQTNSSTSTVEPAAFGAVTVSTELGPVRPFLGVLGVAWLADQRARVTLTPSDEVLTRPLPRGAATVYAGVAWPGRAR
jgi:hypothetical protein